MKNYNKFIPLLILLALVALVSVAILKNTKKIILSEDQISNDFFATVLKQKIKLPEFSLPDLYDDDKNFSIKDLQNNEKKYSVINFFASWCTTCAAEHEVLFHLRDEKFVDLYGVAWRDFSDNTIEFLEKNGNPFKKVATDGQGLFTRILGIKAVPETVIVDSTGHVVMRYQGNLTHENISQIKQFIERK